MQLRVNVIFGNLLLSASLAVFARKARSAFYADATALKPLGTVEAFAAFASLASPAARTWLGRLASVDKSALQSILNEVPNKRMSSMTKAFTVELLIVNQERIVKELV